MFDEPTRALLDGRNFAAVATLNPDGGPQTSLVWILRDGDAVEFSSLAGRRKVRNLAADPRISLTVYDTADPYHSVDIRGTAEILPDPAKTLPKLVTHKYLGHDALPEDPSLERVIVRVTPARVTTFRP